VDKHEYLLPTEVKISGAAASRRIHYLVTHRLVRLGTDASGWETLYRDPQDGRLWEHTYPQSGMHGGGPPALHVISPQAAAAKYGVFTAQ
jgi:hypothetical protein